MVARTMTVSVARKPWTITGLLFLFMFVNFADKAVIGLAAVPMMHDLGLGPTQWGLVVGSFYYLFPIAAALVGFIVNRVPSRHAITVMALVWALTQFPMAGAVSLATLVACRVLLGVGEGPAYPVALHAAYKWFPDAERPLPTSIIAIGSSVGVFTAAPILAAVIATVSWHAAFFGLGVLGLAWAAAWMWLGEEGPLAASLPEPRADAGTGGRRMPYARLLSCRSFLGILGTTFAVYWGLAQLIGWLPAFLQQGQGYSVTASTVVVTLTWGATAVLLPLSGWLSQRAHAAGWSSRAARGVPAGLLPLVSGFAMVAALSLPAGTAQLALLVLGYSLGGVIFALGPAILGEIAPPEQRGAVLGLNTAIPTVAGLVSPLVTGYVISAAPNLHQGYVDAFMLTGAIVALGGLCGLVLIRPEQDRARLEAASA